MAAPATLYDKCWRLQHYLGSDMPGRSQSTLLVISWWYFPIGVQGMVLSIAVDLSALPYLLCPFPGPHRAGVPGRLVLVGSDCASRRRVVSRGLVRPRSETWVGVRKRCLTGPSGRRGGPESEASIVPSWPGLPVGEAGRSRKRALFLLGQAFRSERRARVRSERVLLWPGLPVGDWIALLACH